MNDMFDVQQNIGLDRKIFNVCGTEFHFLNNAYSNAYSQLLKGVHQHSGLFFLTSEPGMGKTLLLHKLENQQLDNIKFIFCDSANLAYEDLITVICNKLGMEIIGCDLIGSIIRLKEFLQKNHVCGVEVAFLIDDAHHLAEAVLYNLITLFDFELGDDCAPRLVLSGTSLLEENFERIGIKQVLGADILRVGLEPMTPADVVTYLSNKKDTSVLDIDALFLPIAIQKITHYSRGNPCLINRLYERVLLITQLHERKVVAVATIDEAASELILQEKSTHASDTATVVPLDKTICSHQRLSSINPEQSSDVEEKVISENSSDNQLSSIDETKVEFDRAVNQSILRNLSNCPATAVSFATSSMDSVDHLVNLTKANHNIVELSKEEWVERIMREEFDEETSLVMRWSSRGAEVKNARSFRLQKLQLPMLVIFALLAGLLGGIGSIYLFHPNQDKQDERAVALSPAKVQETGEQPAAMRQDGEPHGLPKTSETEAPHSSLASTSAIKSMPAADSSQASQTEPNIPTVSRPTHSNSQAKSAVTSTADLSEPGLKSPPVSSIVATESGSAKDLPISSYLERGHALLSRGDVASARLFYQEAANLGSSEAMAAVGKTYDPVALDKLGIKGFQTDPAKAAEWYIKAREAGYTEITEYLQALRKWMAGSPDFKGN